MKEGNFFKRGKEEKGYRVPLLKRKEKGGRLGKEIDSVRRDKKKAKRGKRDIFLSSSQAGGEKASSDRRRPAGEKKKSQRPFPLQRNTNGGKKEGREQLQKDQEGRPPFFSAQKGKGPPSNLEEKKKGLRKGEIPFSGGGGGGGFQCVKGRGRDLSFSLSPGGGKKKRLLVRKPGKGKKAEGGGKGGPHNFLQGGGGKREKKKWLSKWAFGLERGKKKNQILKKRDDLPPFTRHTKRGKGGGEGRGRRTPRFNVR